MAQREPPDHDFSLHFPTRARQATVLDLGHFREDPVESSHGGRTPLNQIGDPSDSHHRPGEKVQVADKGNEVSRGDPAQNGESTSHENQDGQSQARENHHHGREEPNGLCKLHVFGNVLVSFIFDLSVSPALLGVGFDHTNAGKGLPNLFGEI